MSQRVILNQINEAVAKNDIERLRLIEQIVLANSTAYQPDGEMSPTYQLSDTPEARKALMAAGITYDDAVEEGLALDIANAVANAIRRVEFRLDKIARPDFPVVVAEGDSWFLHQMLPDTLDHMRSEFNVRSLAAAGDTVANMLRTDDYLQPVVEENARVFLFSGGGNDTLGEGRIDAVVRPENLARQPHELIIDQRFSDLLNEVIRLYQHMIARLAQEAPDVQIFSHGYDYLFKIEKGPWIWPYLQAKGYGKKRARAVVRILLDRFNDALARVSADNANFTYLDTRNLIGAEQSAWYDAIHPKGAGFERVASRFAQNIRLFLAQTGNETAEVRRTAHIHRRSPPRFHKAETVSEAIIRGYGRQGPTDFEAVRRAVNSIDIDKSKWRQFTDPSVHEQIEDVIKLLRNIEQDEDPQRVRNRLETRPSSMVSKPFGDPGLIEELPASVLTEALFGANDLEPVRVLQKGYQVSRAVGRIQVMSPHGTHIGHGSGFLVAPGLLLTNHHVLHDVDEAQRSFIIFDDEAYLEGLLSSPRQFRITGDVFTTSATADYAFASVESVDQSGNRLSDYGHLPLIKPSGKAIKFEPVSVVQHPGGKAKAIAIRNSFIMGRVRDGAYYTADTQGGSSGSPVFNREWQVVALHHRYVPHPIDKDLVLANRGVRVSCIYRDLDDKQSRGETMAARVLAMISTSRETNFPEEGGCGLLRRRDEEVELFQSGLNPSPVETQPSIHTDSSSHTEYDPTPDLDEQSEIAVDAVGTLESGAVQIGFSDVRWVSTFSNNTDYWHLPASAQEKTFALTSTLIEAAISLGHYQPYVTPTGNLIVGIRGARLASGLEAETQSNSVELTEQKPDHHNYCCILAVYHRASGTISAFRASTVPNRGGVASCANRLNGFGGLLANCLPTGCYELCVGTHYGSRQVPTVLRLGTGSGPSSASQVTTLRTRNDGVYGLMDLWDKCRPADNIHPGFAASTADFSSLGCLTVPGSFSGGAHTGIWAKFRRAGGFDGNQHMGQRYNLVLTTGMELAAIFGADGDRSELQRLSHGSRGPLVSRLQDALHITADGEFGPGTKKKLVEFEQDQMNGSATGILSQARNQQLALNVF